MGDGGSHAVMRLHAGLRRAGVDSTVLCVNKAIDSVELIRLEKSRITKKLDSILDRACRKVGLNKALDVTSFRIPRLRAVQEADILTIHGPTYGFCSYLAMPWLTAHKAAVFPLHDMWSFTGHCYHSMGCEKWKIGCGTCPHPEVFPPISVDNTRLEWSLKKWAYDRSQLTVVAPSTWMAQQAKESMLGRFPVLHIPHGVDTEAYQPLDREACRRTLGIPMGKKVMMFLAADLNNKLKGGDLLIDALERLPASLRKEAVLLLLGNGGDKIAKAVDMPSIVLGYVGSDRLKAACYSAADVFVHPSRAEVFGYAVLESMACGTPVVGFRVGGVPDLVRPHVSGVLAEPFDIVQFVGGILEVIEDANHREGMRQRSRQIVKEEYTLDLQIQRYVDLYRQLMAPGLAVTSSVAGTGANASIGAKE